MVPGWGCSIYTDYTDEHKRQDIRNLGPKVCRNVRYTVTTLDRVCQVYYRLVRNRIAATWKRNHQTLANLNLIQTNNAICSSNLLVGDQALISSSSNKTQGVTSYNCVDC
jgi:hypothetical protein